MGLMFARRRADASKQIAVNKAKAHAENHKKAHAKFAAEELAKKGKEIENIEAEIKEQNSADESGTK